MTALPIACTLTPGAMTERLAFIEKLTSDALLARETTERGLCVRLRDTPEIETRVRQLIAAESSCCAFLAFALERAGGELVLKITGPEDAQPVIELFFSPAASTP